MHVYATLLPVVGCIQIVILHHTVPHYITDEYGQVTDKRTALVLLLASLKGTNTQHSGHMGQKNSN